MNRFFAIFGIILIFFIAFLMSNNKRKINLKTVGVGFLLQILFGIFILKVPVGKLIFIKIGQFITKILDFAMEGASFVFGPLCNNPEHFESIFGTGTFIFAIQMIATMVFVLILINIMYYYGIMQRVVAFLGKIMSKLMNVSGAEALSNVASPFVGQIAAQMMIKPYLQNLTRSELLASMTGSMSCISIGLMAVYTGVFNIPAQYLLAASIMAIPGAFVISKIIYPEDCEPQTMHNVKISRRRTSVNVIDAIAKGAIEGMRVGLNVIAVLIALVALIAMIDWFLLKAGVFAVSHLHINSMLFGLDLQHLSMKMILGKLFAIFAYFMGVTFEQASAVGALMGTKFILNEAIAYVDLSLIRDSLNPKSFAIAVFALCGFANLGSIAMQIGGIGELAPNQRRNLSKLGIRALIGGTLCAYMSACIAGIIL